MPVQGTQFFGGSAPFYNGDINQSVRLNGSNTHFRRTFSQGGDRRQATYSFWIKHGDDGNTNYNPIIFSKGDNVANSDTIYFQIRTTGNSGDIYMRATIDDAEKALIVTNRVFRDPSAWYHFVLAFDTEQSTNTDRMKLYVNGVQETDFASVTYPPEDQDMAFGFHSSDGNNSGDDVVIGDYDASESSTYHVNGCLAEFHYVDGQQLTPTNFGEFKNGIWIPKEYTGSHGTIGYHLKFDQTGVGSGASNTIGADSSGNNNHFDSSGIAAHDCNFPDTPENNFCTLHPQARRYGQSYMATFSEGNLKFVSGGNATNVFGTMAINQIVSQGGVYFELRFDSIDNVRTYFGVIGDTGVNNKCVSSNSGGYTFPIKGMLSSTPRGYFTTDTDASNSEDLTANTAFSNGDVAGIAILSDGKFFVHRNGTYLNNEDGNTGNPSTGANPIATIDLSLGDWFPYLGYSSSYSANFGQDGTFAGQETSGGNSDTNGIGDFMFAVPTNCLALCTSNMVEPAIGPNSSTQAVNHFGTLAYTGDGNQTRTITSGATGISGEIDFQPDWIAHKIRTGTTQGTLNFDSTRGFAGANGLDWSSNGAPGTVVGASSAEYGFISGVGTNSFDVNDGTTSTNGGYVNYSTRTYVAWNWRANGGTTSTNDDGSIQSTVQANTTAGFSIVKATSPSSGTWTVGHGLGATPDFIIQKYLASNSRWTVWHNVLTSGQYLGLNENNAVASSGTPFNFTFNSTVIGGNSNYDGTSTDVIYYVFRAVDGYSKFGSYIARSSSASTPNHDGIFIYTGFSPAWIMIKRLDGTGNWNIHDNVRAVDNPMKNFLLADATNTEITSEAIEFLSNGVKLRSASGYFDHPAGGEFIYWAFAEQPFKYANAR